MYTPSCTDVQGWLPSLEPATLVPSLTEHVCNCPRCRAALLLLAVELFHVPLEVTATMCDQCQAALAAYIDLERNEGRAKALHAYPSVWWHLWICADCAELYETIVLLQEAEATGSLAPLPLVSLGMHASSQVQRPVIRTITLPRLWFTRVLVPQFGPVWGQDDADTVLHEEANDRYQFNVTVHKERGQWMVVITLDPPLDGNVLLAFGATTFRAPFGPDGVADVGPIPADLLTNPDGPDLAIMIEPVPA